MAKVDKNLIKQRKAMYGDNFECIAKTWTGHLNLDGDAGGTNHIEPYEVALMMAEMKQCRIDAIDKKLKEFPTPEVYLELMASKEDSQADKANYMWIAKNYEEYKGL